MSQWYNSVHFDHHAYMNIALTLARKAAAWGEVPVGALVVYRPTAEEEYIISRAFNLRETYQDPSAHAELLALRQASQALGQWRLIDCDLYVTLEPCLMCAGALVNARIQRVIYGCDDYKAGACRSIYQIPSDTRLNHRYEVIPHIQKSECQKVLQTFFQARRTQNKKRRMLKNPPS